MTSAASRTLFGILSLTLVCCFGCSVEPLEAQQKKPSENRAAKKAQKKKVPIGTHIQPARPKKGHDKVAGGLRGVKIPVEAFKSLAFSHDGNLLAAGAGDGSVVVWETTNHLRVVQLQAHENWAFDLVFASDDRHLITGGGDNAVRIWDTKQWKLQTEYTVHADDVHGVAVSSDGNLLVSGADDTFVKVRDLKQKMTRELAGHKEQVTSLTVSTQGAVASGSRDDTVRLWNLATGELQATITSYEHDVLDVEFNVDGSRLASASYDGTIQIHNVETGNLDRTLIGHRDWVFAVAWSPDGKQLASGAADGTVRLWNAETGSLEQLFITGRDGAALTYSPDGKSFAVGFPNGRVEVYSRDDGRFRPRRAMNYGNTRRYSLSQESATGPLDDRVYVEMHERLSGPERGLAIAALKQTGDEFSLKYMQSLEKNARSWSPDEREQLALAISAVKKRVTAYAKNRQDREVAQTFCRQWLTRVALAELQDSPLKGVLRGWVIDRIKPYAGNLNMRSTLQRVESKYQVADRRPTAIGIVERDGKAKAIRSETGAVGALETRVRKLAALLLSPGNRSTTAD